MYFDDAITTIIKECPDKKTSIDLQKHIEEICCEKGTEGLVDLSKKLLVSITSWKNDRSVEVKTCLEQFIEDKKNFFDNCTNN